MFNDLIVDEEDSFQNKINNKINEKAKMIADVPQKKIIEVSKPTEIKKDSFSLLENDFEKKINIKKQTEVKKNDSEVIKDKPKKLIQDKKDSSFNYNEEFSILSNNNHDGLFDKVLNQVQNKNKGKLF